MVDLTDDNASASDMSPNVPQTEVTQWLMEQLSTDDTAMKKFQVARSLTNVDVCLVDINSIERRLIASLFYSLGCHFTPKFSQEDDRRERDNVFRQVWSMLPNLQPFGTMKLNRTNGSSSLYNHCKDAFVRPFRNMKNKKRKSDSLENS